MVFNSIEYMKEYNKRPEVKKRLRDYFKNNKDKFKRYRKNNLYKIKENGKKWRENNCEKVKENNKEYYEINKHKFKDYHKKRYEEKKEIIKLKSKEYKEEHKDYYLKYCRNYYHKHKKVNNVKRKDYFKEHYQKNKEKVNEYHKYRKRTDKNFKIACNLRTSFNRALRIYTKTGKIMPSKKYGVDYKENIEYLEKNKLIPKDYSTSKNKYHIHHIKPLYTFNFVHKDDSTNLKEVKRAFAPENHIILTKEEHKEIHRKLNPFTSHRNI